MGGQGDPRGGMSPSLRSMEWLTALAWAAVAALLTLATPTILRALSEPADDPDKRPYASLATVRFTLGVGACCLVAGGIVSWRLPLSLWPAWGAMASLGTLLGAIDARTTYLPRVLCWWGWALTALGVAVSAWWMGTPTPLVTAAVCSLAAGGFFAAVWWVGGGKLGFGDVRLAFMIGGVTGAVSWQLTMWAVFAGTLTALVWGIAVALWKRRDGAFAYGPGLIVGTFVAVALNAA